MALNLSLGVSIGSISTSSIGEVAIRVTITGLTGGVAQIGTHATIGAVMSDGSTITAYKWGSTSGGSQYGTGSAPTDFAAGDEGALHLTATAGGVDYTRSAAIRYAAPAFSVQPSITGTAEVGQTLTLDEGEAGPSATITIEEFTLGGVDKTGELTGLTWDSTGEEPAVIRLQTRATNSGGFVLSEVVTLDLAEAPAGPPTVNGVQIGEEGGTGTLYEGYALAAGDDFASPPTRWTGANTAGKYAHSALSYGFRQTSPNNDVAMYIDPAYRGARSESPTPLGYDGTAVADSVLTLTASAPPSELLPFLPTTFTGGRGDGGNRPKLITGSLKSAPHFMLSAQADFILETRVRLADGMVRGYWPSFWSTTFFWPEFGELDVVEVRKNPTTGANAILSVLHGNLTDGGSSTNSQIASTTTPANTWVHVLIEKVGDTVTLYDDIAEPGTLAVRATNNTTAGQTLASRLRGAHDIRLDLAVSNGWDNTTFDAADWPEIVEFDWWRAWVPAAAGANPESQYLPAVNTTPGGSWAATFPSAVDLHGAGAGFEQVTAAWDNFDAPGFATRNGTTKLPWSMTVDLSARTVSGTVPTTEGGCLPLLFTYAYDDGTPASRVFKSINVAPAFQTLFGSNSIGVGVEVDLTVNYTDFHSGNLGPHTYSVNKTGGSWLTITGEGTDTLTISGTSGETDETVTLEIVCTNAIGQTTTVTRTITVAAATAYADWTGPGWFDASDSLVMSGSEVTSVVNKRAGGGNLTGEGTTSSRARALAAQNGLNALRLTRDVASGTAGVPRFSASVAAAVSAMFQGNDKPFTTIIAFRPTDENTGFIWSASDTILPSDFQDISQIRRTSACSVRRQLSSAANNDVNFGSGQASGVPIVVAVKHTGTTVSVWENSTTKTVDAVTQNTATFGTGLAFTLFAARRQGSADPTFNEVQCSLDFYEMVVDDTARTDEEIQQAMTDIAAKWGIALS